MRPHIRLGDVVVDWLEEDKYLQLNEEQEVELRDIRKDLISLTVQSYARRVEPSIVSTYAKKQEQPEHAYAGKYAPEVRIPLPDLEDEALEPYKHLRKLYEDAGLEPDEVNERTRNTSQRVCEACGRALWDLYHSKGKAFSMN